MKTKKINWHQVWDRTLEGLGAMVLLSITVALLTLSYWLIWGQS